MSSNCFFGLTEATGTLQATDYTSFCFNSNLSQNITYRTLSLEDSSKIMNNFAPSIDMDKLWVFICAALVFFMQLGFLLLEAGAVTAASVQNILFKNLMDACINGLLFYIFGYGIAYGSTTSSSVNGFIGVEEITLESESWNSYFFQWAFAATASTIVSGAVAERCATEAYFIYTIAISAWIYPVVVHWAWDVNGWISAFNEKPILFKGVIDFAGSGVVHMVGGVSSLIGSIALGPRLNRFETNSKKGSELQHQHIFGNNVVYQSIGTLILWFGWYGFNCGSTLAAQNSMNLASKVAVMTTLSAASGGITAGILSILIEKYWSVPRICNGILAGLVSITAGCSVIDGHWSILIGILGCIFYYSSSLLIEKLKIDDVLDAFSVHGIGGAWGVLSVGIFATKSNILEAYGNKKLANIKHYKLFITQLIFVLCVFLWTAFNSGVVFFILKKLKVLRVSEKVERTGIDVSEFGGSFINFGPTYLRTKSVDEKYAKIYKNKQMHIRQPDAMKTQNNINTVTNNGIAEAEAEDDNKENEDSIL